MVVCFWPGMSCHLPPLFAPRAHSCVWLNRGLSLSACEPVPQGLVRWVQFETLITRVNCQCHCPSLPITLPLPQSEACPHNWELSAFKTIKPMASTMCESSIGVLGFYHGAAVILQWLMRDWDFMTCHEARCGCVINNHFWFVRWNARTWLAKGSCR